MPSIGDHHRRREVQPEPPPAALFVRRDAGLIEDDRAVDIISSQHWQRFGQTSTQTAGRRQHVTVRAYSLPPPERAHPLLTPPGSRSLWLLWCLTIGQLSVQEGI